MSPRTEGAQSVGRAVEILRTVARCQRSGATLSKVMRATELPRTTAFRLLRYLTEERMLQFDNQGRCYYLGPLAYELGLAAQGQSGFVPSWKDRIDRLAARTGMTAYLVARSVTEVVCLATAQGQSVVRAVPLDVGQRLPLGVGAGSLAILSSLPDGEIDAIIGANELKLRMYGAGRLTRKVLWGRVLSTRANGYALSRDSVAPGVMGIGLVVPHGDELTQLAVSVSSVADHAEISDGARLADIIRRIANI